MKGRRKIFLTVSAFILLFGSNTVTTLAQTDEPLLGCVKPGTGLLRILQPGETCKNNETPLGFDDLPLLVALRNQVRALQIEVKYLKDRVKALEECVGSYCNQE